MRGDRLKEILGEVRGLIEQAQASLDDRPVLQRVLTALRESKVDEETELWLRRLRDEAYVEIRNP